MKTNQAHAKTAKEVLASLDGSAATLAEATIESTGEKVQEQARAQVLAYLRGEKFAKLVEGEIDKLISDLVLEVIGARMSEIEGRVQAIVAAKFEDSVARIARDRLEKALAEVRSKL